MTIHYHGVPISPLHLCRPLGGRHFCVSWGTTARSQVVHLQPIASGLLFDNGAFTYHRTGESPDWSEYYEWLEPRLGHPHWAIIPDSIGGTEAEQDALVDACPVALRPWMAPVWHLHEPIARLRRLCDAWPRVCFGSSEAYWEVGGTAWLRRVDEAFRAIAGPTGRVATWVHMLRGLSVVRLFPFASADSSNVARNHNTAGRPPIEMIEEIDAVQSPLRMGDHPNHNQQNLGLVFPTEAA